MASESCVCMRSLMVPTSGGEALSQICERGIQARVLRLTGGADQPTEGGGLIAKMRAMASSSKKNEDKGTENEKGGWNEEADINNIENFQKANSKLGFEQAAAQTSRFPPRRTACCAFGHCRMRPPTSPACPRRI